MVEKEFAPVTPGEMLKRNSWPSVACRKIHLRRRSESPQTEIAEIVNNRRRITADTALRLSLYFGNSPQFWTDLQTHYDLKMARKNLKPDDAKRIKARRAA